MYIQKVLPKLQALKKPRETKDDYFNIPIYSLSMKVNIQKCWEKIAFLYKQVESMQIKVQIWVKTKHNLYSS